MTPQGALPQASDSQRIGLLAEKCFNANRPDDWTASNLGGTDDFGFDYLVQTLPGQRATDVFKVQLKGTTVPALNAAQTHFSIDLKASTVRYYARSVEPILLVVADLSVAPAAKNCPLYYAWIHDELRRINVSGLPEHQQYVTLRVPKANQLTDHTDLSSDIQQANKLSKAGLALDLAIEQKDPSLAPDARAELIYKIPTAITARGASLMEALASDQPAPWLNPPRGSLAWQLTEIEQHLRTGNTDETETLLASAQALLPKAEPAELPEYWFLKARFVSLNGELQQASDLYLKACELGNNQPKYLSSWAESEIRRRYILDGTNDFTDLLEKLTGTDPSILGIKARIFAAEGKYDEGIALARSFSGIESLVALVIIYAMQGKPEKAIDVSDQALALPDLKASTKQLFLVMRARARFHLAIGDAALNYSEELLPPSGLPETDIALLLQAWDDIEEAVMSLRSAGWPPNVEFLSDVWAATASILGKQKQALPLLMNAANARQNLVALQSAAESLAAQCFEFSAALEANARQPQSDSTVCRRIALLHTAKKDKECVELFQQHASRLDIISPVFGEALSLAILSADRLVRTDLVNSWLKLFQSAPHLAPAGAVIEYFLQKAKNRLGSEVVLARLEERYEALGHPFLIAVHLFHELDPTDPIQAEKCIAIGERLRKERLLHIDAALHLAQAQIALAKWDDLLDLSTGALRRFEASDRLAAMEALALDKLGHTVEARAILERLIKNGITDALALNTYVNIVVRCGFIDEAIRSVESILSTAEITRQKLECLRLLYNLTHIKDPTDPRALELVWRIGELVDQADEIQEGMFLSMVLSATALIDSPPPEDSLEDFQQRLAVFFEKFPDSSILKRAQFSENDSADEMWETILKTVGSDEERQKARKKFETQMQRGDLHVPYAWRPKHILENVHDLPVLWEIGKRSKHEERQYQLQMTLASWGPTPIEEMRKHTVLLDFISLIVAQDLKILDKIFLLFPKIAIGQATLAELGRLTLPLSGSPVRNKCLALQDALKDKFDQILQPFVQEPSDDGFRLARWPSEEVRELVGRGEYMLYSDDAISRHLCCPDGEGRSAICALDILYALEHECLMLNSEVAEKIAQLYSWRVGLTLESKYQKAILPQALFDARSVNNGLQILRSSDLCMAVFDSIWDIDKPIENFQGHGGALLRELVDQHNMSTTAIASLMGLWYIKARLRHKAPQPRLKSACLLILQAAHFQPLIGQASSNRLWTVFKDLVELEHGNTMDEQKEKDGIALLGKTAAELDLEGQLHGEESFKRKLENGLTKETSESETFQTAYTQARVSAAANALTKNRSKN